MNFKGKAITIFLSFFLIIAYTFYAQANDDECDTVAKRVCTDEKIRRSIDWKEWHALALDSIMGKMYAANYKYADTADEVCTRFKNAATMIRSENQHLSPFQKDVIRGACVDSSKSIEMFIYYGVGK